MKEEITSSAEQSVQCMVCNKAMKSITNSHLKKHGMSCKEYKKAFPESSMGDFSRFDSWRKSEENKAHMKRQYEIIYSSSDLSEKRLAALRKASQEEAYRKKLSESLKKYAQTPIGKYRLANKPVTQRMKMSNFQRWVEEFGLDEAMKKQKEWQLKNILPYKSRDTKPELILANLLNEVSIRFIKQFSIFRYYCDFYLPDYNLIIEVDGDYWHANPKKYSAEDEIGGKKMKAQQIWEVDQKKSDSIISQGFNLMRIWSSDLKKLTSQGLIDDIVQHCEKSP